jgi:hypothetical protein
MNRRTISNGIGCLSVACSLAIWAWAGFFLFTPLNRSDAWLEIGYSRRYLWPMLWILDSCWPWLPQRWGRENGYGRQFWPLVHLRPQYSLFLQSNGEPQYRAAGGSNLNLQPCKLVSGNPEVTTPLRRNPAMKRLKNGIMGKFPANQRGR